MKKNNFALICLSFALISSSALVSASVNEKNKELFSDIKLETKKCAVQIISTKNETENESVLGFKSICKSLKITSGTQARILIDGEWLKASIVESAESDGGDLDDLIISNSSNKVLAIKTNIPAYDNVVVAMAGDSNFFNQQNN